MEIVKVIKELLFKGIYQQSRSVISMEIITIKCHKANYAFQLKLQ